MNLDYKLHISKRAKHVRLRIDEHLQLHLTVPAGFDTREIPDILRRKRRWIENARQRLGQRSEQRKATTTLPDRIHLQACDEHWQVVYQSHPLPHLLCTVDNQAPNQSPYHSADQRLGNRLLCQLPESVINRDGDITDPAPVRELLRQWLLKRARYHLQPLLDDISTQIGLPYQDLRVRTQKTRWGSCSSKGNINLNAQLMFLPPEWVEHVLIHEICHLQHPNHSPAFWALVSQYDMNYLQIRQDMKAAWQHIPGWSR